jgi:hypothetical protein
MLPDYPKLKKEISEVLDFFFRKRVEQYSMATSGIAKSRRFEGRSSATIMSSGEKNEFSLFKCETSMEISYKDVPTLDILKIFKMIDKAADDFAGQMDRSFYKSISEIMEKTGQTVNQKGRPISGEIILEALQKLFIPFDKQKNPELPQFHIHPDLGESFKKAIRDLHEDPELDIKFKELISRKWEEWRAHEASRKLVG